MDNPAVERVLLLLKPHERWFSHEGPDEVKWTVTNGSRVKFEEDCRKYQMASPAESRCGLIIEVERLLQLPQYQGK
jgi:hypothetical protein